MAVSERTIVVMRHAKAEPTAPSDAERPLAERGHADAAEAGRWLAAQGLVPDHALVSAAVRTRETFAEVDAAAGWGLEPDVDRGLYSAGVDTALDLVGLVDDGHRSLIVVGHNPTMAHLATLLDDGEAPAELSDQVLMGFPTSALATFTFEGSWNDLAPGAARLTAYHVGRAGD